MKWLNSFRLSTSEKKGLWVLSAFIVLAIVVRVIIVFLPSPEVKLDGDLESEMLEWQADQKAKRLVKHRFDPNAVSDSFIHELSISSFAQKNWIAFLERNHQFYTADDLYRIYGMDSLWLEINRDSIYIDIKPEVAEQKGKKLQLHPFDPNTISLQALLDMNFPNGIANRIMNYRNSGGSFAEPADLKKIYGFPEELFLEAEEFIDIKEVVIPERENGAADFNIVDLNTADSTSLVSIKGVGPVYAHRIVQYREKLGGFHTLAQLEEVYGLTNEMVNDISPFLSLSPGHIRMLNINKDPFKLLLAHPYLNYNQVKSIVGYRERMGDFKNIDDLVLLEGFSAEDVEKVKPYLRIE